jgi:hypothetical protein
LKRKNLEVDNGNFKLDTRIIAIFNQLKDMLHENLLMYKDNRGQELEDLLLIIGLFVKKKVYSVV